MLISFHSADSISTSVDFAVAPESLPPMTGERFDAVIVGDQQTLPLFER